MASLKTGVSAAFWCNSKGEYHPAEWWDPQNPAGSGTTAISWLDHLLVGGLVLSNAENSTSPVTGSKSALTVLITGPPGAGKTALAMELCYRWSLMENKVEVRGKRGAFTPCTSPLKRRQRRSEKRP